MKCPLTSEALAAILTEETGLSFVALDDLHHPDIAAIYEDKDVSILFSYEYGRWAASIWWDNMCLFESRERDEAKLLDLAEEYRLHCTRMSLLYNKLAQGYSGLE